jgi:hypothetical protein
MPGSVDEHMFEQQRDEPGEDHGPDIDDDRRHAARLGTDPQLPPGSEVGKGSR